MKTSTIFRVLLLITLLACCYKAGNAEKPEGRAGILW